MPPSLGRNQGIFSYKFSRDLSKSRRDLSGFSGQTLREQQGGSVSAVGLRGAESSTPGDSRGHGSGPSTLVSFPLLRAKRSPPTTQPRTSHPFPKGHQALGFIVKPQKRSLFHLRHCSEPTGQHCPHSRFSSSFPNDLIDSVIVQSINNSHVWRKNEISFPFPCLPSCIASLLPVSRLQGQAEA